MAIWPFSVWIKHNQATIKAVQTAVAQVVPAVKTDFTQLEAAVNSLVSRNTALETALKAAQDAIKVLEAGPVQPLVDALVSKVASVVTAPTALTAPAPVVTVNGATGAVVAS